eukprot:7376504-Prymnesium_polylepis.4
MPAHQGPGRALCGQRPTQPPQPPFACLPLHAQPSPPLPMRPTACSPLHARKPDDSRRAHRGRSLPHCSWPARPHQAMQRSTRRASTHSGASMRSKDAGQTSQAPSERTPSQSSEQTGNVPTRLPADRLRATRPSNWALPAGNRADGRAKTRQCCTAQNLSLPRSAATPSTPSRRRVHPCHSVTQATGAVLHAVQASAPSEVQARLCRP